MYMEIPQFWEKLSKNTFEDKTKNNYNVITSIPPELPTVYNPNTLTTSFKILSWREDLTYLRNNYEHFLSADAEITTPMERLLIDIGAIDPQEIKNKHSKIGEVLITPRGWYITEFRILRQRDDLAKEELLKILTNEFENCNMKISVC